MQKINIIINKNNPSTNKIKRIEKTIEIEYSLFNIALRKGLVKKTDDGYIFIGDNNELLAFKKNKKKNNSFEFLD